MQDLHSADYGALRAFVAVAEALSFSRAARTLGVSPSSLSQTVQGLEQRLGVRLLHRTTRNVSPTEAGAALLARTRPALDELSAAVATARAGRHAVEGVLRLHAFPIIAELFLAPLLPAVHRVCPGLVLDLTLDDAVVDLAAGGFDAGLRLGEVVDRDMVAIPLGPELRQTAVASPAYLAAHGRPVTPHDLLAHRCIRWRWRGREEPYAWEFHRSGRWFSVAVDGPVIADRRGFCIEAAVRGLGIAFAVEASVAPAIAAGELVPLLEDWSAPFPGFVLCYPRAGIMRPQLKAFLDVVRREVWTPGEGAATEWPQE